MFFVYLSRLLAIIGLKIVNKQIYRKNYFLKESRRLMAPIQSDYNILIERYDSTKDYEKAVENQSLFMEMVYWLDLPNRIPCRIIDIGGRAGLFAYYCQAYGHEAFITDLHKVLDKSPNREILDLLQVQRFELKVNAFEPLVTPGKRFELVTGFRTRFHSRLPHETGKKYEEHWGISEWKYFLEDLSCNVLTEKGRIFFMLNPLQEHEKGGGVPRDIASFFASVGGKLRQNFLYFSNINRLQNIS